MAYGQNAPSCEPLIVNTFVRIGHISKHLYINLETPAGSISLKLFVCAGNFWSAVF